MKTKEALQDYKNRKGLSLNVLSKKLSYSPSVLSQYLNGEYTGDVEKLEQAIDSELRREQRREKNIDVGFVATKAYNHIYHALALAQAEKTMGFIVGYAGVGKTYAIEKFRMENEKSTIVIQGEPGLRENDVIRKIANCCNLTHNSVSVLKENLVAYLQERECIIIVDEANYLRPAILDTLRRVCHDQGGAAIVFFGVKELMTNVFLNSMDFDQLQRRITVFVDLAGIKLEYKEAQAIVETITREMKESHIRLMLEYANSNVGVFVTLLKRVLKTADMNVSAISDSDIEACKNQILKTASLKRRLS